jgi:hypothetical protein
MQAIQRITFGSIVAACLFMAPGVAEAKSYTGSYSKVHAGQGYSYRYFNYYSPRAKEHKYHFAVYHPAHPRYVYFYNPTTKKYWGRYDLKACGYSMLAEEDRKPTIGEIPECAFPKAGQIPPPEAGIDESMLPPPELDKK